MPATLVKQEGNQVTVQLTVTLSGQMLKQFDTKGEPIRVGHIKHTVKD